MLMEATIVSLLLTSIRQLPKVCNRTDKTVIFVIYQFNFAISNTYVNPLSVNPRKWSNTLKRFVGELTVFDHFVGLVLKGLMK